MIFTRLFARTVKDNKYYDREIRKKILDLETKMALCSDKPAEKMRFERKKEALKNIYDAITRTVVNGIINREDFNLAYADNYDRALSSNDSGNESSRLTATEVFLRDWYNLINFPEDKTKLTQTISLTYALHVLNQRSMTLEQMGKNESVITTRDSMYTTRTEALTKKELVDILIGALKDVSYRSQILVNKKETHEPSQYEITQTLQTNRTGAKEQDVFSLSDKTKNNPLAIYATIVEWEEKTYSQTEKYRDVIKNKTKTLLPQAFSQKLNPSATENAIKALKKELIRQAVVEGLSPAIGDAFLMDIDYKGSDAYANTKGRLQREEGNAYSLTNEDFDGIKAAIQSNADKVINEARAPLANVGCN